MGHIDNLTDASCEVIKGAQEARLFRQINVDCRLDAFKQELRMRCRIEEAIKIAGFTQDLDIAFGRCAPVNDREQSRRIALKHGAVVIDSLKDGG